MSAGMMQIDLETFRRYAGLSLPRHVSYPMPTAWRELDDAEANAMRQESRQQASPNDISLYLHIPFCEKLCRYCACTRKIQRKNAPLADKRTADYVAALDQEIRQLADLLGADQAVRQIHWGGGTPTYLDSKQITALHKTMAASFKILPDAEVAIELDPRVLTPEMVQTLASLGFNRASLGVQDFDLQVQEHVHRVQSLEMVRDTVESCREAGFTSVNFDLIYGLPYQTVETVRDTIAKTVDLGPDRIAFYHYAQIPEKIATQRGMDYTKLPDSETKLEMFLLGLKMFEEAGYVFIGLDHFAKPEEPLARALRDGTLQRNFQGMTTGGGLDLFGLGASSISHVAGIGFLQNTHDIDEYVANIEDGASSIRRGKRLTEDDRIRQALLSQLYGVGEINPKPLEDKFGINFATYFKRELAIMRELQEDGLVTVGDDDSIQATLPLGRVLIRNIAGVFDAYLEPDAYRVGDKRCFSASA